MMKRKVFLIVFGILSVSVLLAQVKISGVVTDARDNTALSGVNVKIRNNTTSVVTDQDGRYAVIAEIGDILEFSYIGMIPQSVVLKTAGSVNLQLVTDAINLEEVVTVGYGTMKKSDLTGSVASIKPDNLSNARVGTATSALQGLAAGVYVTTGSVKPGGDASVVIRGQSSLRAGNAPLYIVDGMPVQGGLQDLSPNDIASIEVLKDASSASIYGSRGSNGVILITTKSGTQGGKGQLNFNASVGVQNMLNKQQLLNAQQYYELVSFGLPNYQWTSDDLRWLSRGESTDWQDEITQNGKYQNYNLSARGGNEQVTHYLGVDWYNQLGTIKNSSFNRATIRYNLDAQTTDWLRSGIRFNVIESNLKNINEEQDSGYGTMFSAISAQPTAPVFTEDGEYFNGFLNSKANPVALVELLDKPTKKSRVVGSFYFEVEPIRDLVIRSDNGGELQFFNVNSYEDGRMGPRYTTGGHATKFSGKRRYLQSENTVTYTRDTEEHRVQVMAGFSASKIDYEEFTADSKNISPILRYNNLGSAQEHGPNGSFSAGSTLVSFYGRANYGYNEKFLATLTIRGDGSSRFAPGNRWGFFPSMAIAWRISEEEFMKNQSLFNSLKIRTSVGMLGNQNIGDYAYTATISQGGEWSNYVFAGNVATGAVHNTIGNPELTWEKSQHFDLGIDFGLFGNRVAGTADLYYKKTSDLLWSVPLPQESGFSNSLTNIGQIDNKGLELTLNTVNIYKTNFSWTSAFNISFNKNEIVELYGGKQDVNKSLFVGRPIDQLYLLDNLGIWQQEEAAEAAKYNAFPGDRKVLDLDGNNIVNGDDRIFAGQSVPKFYGSFSNTINFKSVDFVVFATYASGHMINNSLNRYLNSFNTWGNTGLDYFNNYWKPERPSNTYPAPRVGSPYANGDGTDAHLQKGDYIRIRNIEAGYTFANGGFIRRAKLNNLRLYLSVQNLLTLTEFTGYDVESSDRTNPYPNSVSFISGLSFSF